MVKKAHSKTKFELTALVLYPVFATLISLFWNVNVFNSVTLFLIVPSIYLSLIAPKYIKKSILFSLLAVPMLLVIDYVAHVTGQWVVPTTVFPARIFDLVPIEDSFWAFFLTYYTVMFYEHFVDKHRNVEVLTSKFKTLALIGIFVPMVGLIYFLNSPTTENIRYFYVIFGTILFLIPLILVRLKFSKLFVKLSKAGAYFFYVTFLYEITALKVNWWYFPSNTNFIGWIHIFNLSFPLEELVFWLMLCAMGTLVWFEYFDDDMR